MKKYFKILAITLALVITLGSTGVFAAGTENKNKYVKPEKFIYGDVDLDGSVTVKDATLIQKGLAKVTYVTAVQRYLADPDGTGYSIKNATAIQKYLAKYKTSTPWNTEIIMASQDEFSKSVSTSGNYENHRFIIGVKQINGIDYAKGDFPELNLKSIETYAEFDNIKITAYYLYLEAPSKENVLNAIKELDYRANIDILWAEPDYIFYPVNDSDVVR